MPLISLTKSPRVPWIVVSPQSQAGSCIWTRIGSCHQQIYPEVIVIEYSINHNQRDSTLDEKLDLFVNHALYGLYLRPFVLRLKRNVSGQMTPPPSHTVCFTGGGVISYFDLFLGAISHLILPTHPLTFNGMVPYLLEHLSYTVAHYIHHVRCGIFRCM